MSRARKRSNVGRSVGLWLLQFVLPLLAAAALLAGAVWAGRLARDDLRRRSPPVAFTDIQCEPPPGMTRDEFLEEARVRAELPRHLDLSDAATAERVRSALLAHPWVADVLRVRVTHEGVSAELEYRSAVLWVDQPGRAVDAAGLLLPVTASREGLAVLAGKVKPPGQPGQGWGDDGVYAAARLVAWLLPRRKAIDPATFRLSVTDGDVTIRRGKQTVIWGRPPGEEKPGEPDAEAKATKLLTTKGDLDLRK